MRMTGALIPLLASLALTACAASTGTAPAVSTAAPSVFIRTVEAEPGRTVDIGVTRPTVRSFFARR